MKRQHHGKEDRHMPPKPKKQEEPRYDLENVASITECTGLIPSALMDEEEADAYRDLYSIHKQVPTD